MKKTAVRKNTDKIADTSIASVNTPSLTAKRLKKAIESLSQSTVKPDPYKKVRGVVRKGETPKAPVTGRKLPNKQLNESEDDDMLQKSTYKHKEILMQQINANSYRNTVDFNTFDDTERE